MPSPVVVVGAGALGSLLAALLGRVAPVGLLARGRAAAVLRDAGGIRVHGLCAGFHPVAVQEGPEIPAGSLVVLAVKAYDLEPVLRALAPQLAACRVLLLQNGLGVRTLAERILGKPVLRGVTFLAAALRGPGEVEFNAAGKTYVPEDAELVALWQEARMPMQAVRDVRLYVWRKLAINACINPLTALLRVENGALLERRAPLRDLVDELVPVARAEGQDLDADETFSKVMASIRQTARNTSSMLQDVRAGRRTEIDWINGAVVRVAERHDLPVPRHRLLVDLVGALAPQVERVAGSR